MSGRNEEHDWNHLMKNDYQETHLYDHIDMDDNYRLGLQDGLESGSKFWVGALSATVLLIITFGLICLYSNGWQLP